MLNEILIAAIAAKASDVHLNIGAKPYFRVNKLVQPSEEPPMSAEYMMRIAKRIMSEARFKEFEAKRDLNFSYEIENVARFRVNAHFQRGALAMSFRIVRPSLARLEDLFLPDAVNRLTRLPRGLVLVTGPAGSGRSTTIAAMIDEINRREKGHIVTLEDPIEYTFTGDRCIIEQRELGSDVPDFVSGLRNALRQDPDTIMVAELRDQQTATAAITAAESGHFVLSTLHTLSAAEAVQRIIDLYPTYEQDQMRAILAGTLAAVISQTLLRRVDQAGMIPAAEIMICNPQVRNCIRENRIFELPQIIETNRAFGMQSMDSSLRQLLATGYISREEAMIHATRPERIEQAQVA
ncbi:MAG: PilT/PilU family type 4a pilus ATPase [Tepidisphaeraceae bacterium]|jgi:twitching motility protein PilT